MIHFTKKGVPAHIQKPLVRSCLIAAFLTTLYAIKNPPAPDKIQAAYQTLDKFLEPNPAFVKQTKRVFKAVDNFIAPIKTHPTLVEPDKYKPYYE